MGLDVEFVFPAQAAAPVRLRPSRIFFQNVYNESTVLRLTLWSLVKTKYNGDY